MSDQNNGKRTIVVNIFGTEYPIRGAEDDEYVQRAAMYVDAKMREVAVRSSLRSTTQVAVLAALNIVDELFKEQAKKGMTIEIDEKVARLTALLRNKIAEPSPEDPKRSTGTCAEVTVAFPNG
ncbi:MAG: cell division protein ZapA [Candidatus Latescibacteria bacterium]|nr:cell division protein ZapA [Candidatus Latescibacterota bacterium]